MQKRTPAVVRGIMAGALLIVSAGAQDATAQWAQWGGPDRNFVVDAQGLADTWPEDGPRKLWHRELGDGYSTILAVDGRVVESAWNTTDLRIGTLST